MRIFKEIQEQYEWLWWWLLNQGIFVASLIVHTFFFAIWVVFMVVFYFVIKWLKGH